MNKITKIIIGLVILAIVVWGGVKLFGTKTGKTSEPIKIGFVGPLTGPVARFGEWSLRGAQLAIDIINKNGGIKGRSVNLIIEDDECVAKKAIDAVNKLQNAQGINKIISVCTATSPAIVPITKDHSVVFSPSFKLASLEKDDSLHYFSIQPSIERELDVLVEYIISREYQTVGIIYTLNDFWTSYKNKLVELLEKRNIRVIIIEESSFLNNDFRTQLNKMKKARPNVIFAGLNPGPLSNFMKQKNELGILGDVVGNWNTQNPDFLDATGILADGFVYTYHYENGITNKNIEYIKMYKEKYKEEPEFGSASTYDIIFILKHLIEECGIENIECAIKKTNQIKNYEGASGLITFLDGGTTLKSIFLKTVKNGQFVKYKK